MKMMFRLIDPKQVSLLRTVARAGAHAMSMPIEGTFRRHQDGRMEK
jgi:hypothetical protein